LGLSGWEIRWGWNESEDWDRDGETMCVYGRQIAVLHLKPTEHMGELEQTIVHELLHIRFWRTISGVSEQLKKVLPKKIYRAWFAMWIENHEHEIDALAAALTNVKRQEEKQGKRR
jgi:hypothetical protein